MGVEQGATPVDSSNIRFTRLDPLKAETIIAGKFHHTRHPTHSSQEGNLAAMPEEYVSLIGNMLFLTPQEAQATMDKIILDVKKIGQANLSVTHEGIPEVMRVVAVQQLTPIEIQVLVYANPGGVTIARLPGRARE